MRSFPLMIVAVIIYNLLAAASWLQSGRDRRAAGSQRSGEDVLRPDLAFQRRRSAGAGGARLLFVEVVKATRTTAVEVINHALSMMVFIIALVEFLTLKPFATTPFFLIMMMALFDIVAGFTISIVAAKRDLGVAGGIIGTN